MGEEFDAIVIGAGEAGAVLASRAVEAGQRVADPSRVLPAGGASAFPNRPDDRVGLGRNVGRQHAQ